MVALKRQSGAVRPWLCAKRQVSSFFRQSRGNIPANSVACTGRHRNNRGMAPPSPDYATLRLSTDPVSPRDRMEFSREVFGRQILNLELEPDPDIALRVDFHLRALPGLKLVTGVASGVRSRRTSALLADSNDDLSCRSTRPRPSSSGSAAGRLPWASATRCRPSAAPRAMASDGSGSRPMTMSKTGGTSQRRPCWTRTAMM